MHILDICTSCIDAYVDVGI